MLTNDPDPDPEQSALIKYVWQDGQMAEWLRWCTRSKGRAVVGSNPTFARGKIFLPQKVSK